ncbi:uncharacterized protein YjcR [Anaerosolibacter carboniphilus]|uniref:Uncharacterized protein YjcR n=1 Tax=Anaerosolibacter carboniphilus TaxID=1417629 RepID=A0A841L0A7_9FIRM|nr:phage terminase small subunit [Anaerosolibacter carboniphilus]MBB6218008.1 uncharacterized protein YjcR [Anaerosolibacter carboniphilus]
MLEIRAPDTKELAKADYLKGMKYKELAEKYGVTLNTIKSWKQRYEWDRKSVHTKESESKKGAHKKRGAPKGNKNAEKHGFFSKWLPEETLEIMNEIETRSPIDLLWDNIKIKYAAIIRAQKIMNVRDKRDETKVLKKKKGQYFNKDDEVKFLPLEEEWEYQHAWDKYANFLNAQSRAMSELRSMIKQYDAMLHSDLATEEQKLRIEKLKSEIDSVGKSGEDTKDWVESIKDIANRRKAK